MKKCDFCKMSNPDGSCPYIAISAREDYCKKAVKRMADALNGSKKKKKKFFNI